jgi:hypothetical protein
MSIFLFYFEINQSNADWKLFQRVRESIEDSFREENENDTFLISKTSIQFKGKRNPAYIIHDGVSSERLMNGALTPKRIKYGPVFLLKFIQRRLSIGGIVAFLTFQWVNNESLQEFVIDGKRIENIPLEYLNRSEFLLKDNIVYRIDE